MPYGDRYWWLKLVAAPLAAARAAATPWWYSVNIAPADQAMGISPPVNQQHVEGVAIDVGR